MLTIGYVAGIIAFAISVVSFVLPNLFVLVLATIVGRQRDAATWSVFGRELQRTAWPSLLRSDTASISNGPVSMRLLSLVRAMSVALIAIAATVTPLGLHGNVAISTRPDSVAFTYIADTGSFGQGTPPRDPDAFYSRRCAQDLSLSSCPYSNTKVTTQYSLTNKTTSWDGTYDVRVPDTTATMFNSHYEDHPSTVAGIFDLQWRQYTYYSSPDYNNGSRYLVAAYKSLNSLLVDDTIQVVDGLIVDTHQGGIGLRNHTAPVELQYGAEWEEELMFISPESVCVNTNLSFEFQIADLGNGDKSVSNSGLASFVNLSIVDHGGFSNLHQVYPEPEGGVYQGQKDSDLQFRAYKAAWINNAWTMLYFNVTNPKQGNYSKAFQYLDSHIGKRFYLDPGYYGVTNVGYGQVQLSTLFGGYLPETGSYTGPNETYLANNISDYGNPDPRSKYLNPWNVTSDNFTVASITCQGAGGQDIANISNIAVNCALMYGAAVRRDTTDSTSNLIAEPGSWWTQPLYSCATGLKANIKRVKFRWNSTAQADGLNYALTVLNVTDKHYDSDAQLPYWAAERLESHLADMNPLWGPISKAKAMAYQHDEHFDVVQSPRLWIPGYPLLGLPVHLSYQNMPAYAFVQALSDAFGTDNDYSKIYSGLASTSIFARWQRLTENTDTAAQIPGLIWTDLAANAITSSRSVLSPKRPLPDTQPIQRKRDFNEDTDDPPLVDGFQNAFDVYPYKYRITYNWPFGIPVFLAIMLLGAVILAISILMVLGRLPTPVMMSHYLNYTSAGRLLALITPNEPSISNYPQDSSSNTTGVEKYPSHLHKRALGDEVNVSTLTMSTREWERSVGRRIVNIDTINGHDQIQQQSSPQYDPGAYVTATRVNYEAVPQY